MSIRLGVYDLFSRIVPGIFYLLAFSEFARTLGWVNFNWRILSDIGLLLSVVLLIIAYVIAAAMDGLAQIWQRIFTRRAMSKSPFERFKLLNAEP